MKLKILEIAEALDGDGELELGCKRSGAMWLDRDGAIQIIKHLERLFGLNTPSEAPTCKDKT